jgi:hypothetical protein
VGLPCDRDDGDYVSWIFPLCVDLSFAWASPSGVGTPHEGSRP